MIDRVLRTQLEPLARDSQKWKLARALAVSWAAFAAAGLSFVLLNRLGGWKSPWAIPFLTVAAICATGVVIFRFRRNKTDYRALARQIERENPELHVVLLTAVEQLPAGPGAELNYLQERVINEALEQHRRSSWGRKIALRLFATRCAQWLALGIFAVSLFALRGRISKPDALFAGAERSGGVSVTPGDTSLERGSGLVVLARFDGKVPTEATLVIKSVNENEQRLPLTKNLSDPIFGGGIPELKADANYHIEFAGNKTRDFKVTVFDYPKLDHADAKITYPTYTGISEKVIKDTRRVSAVEGSTIDYSFYLNKPVKTAQLVAKDKSIVSLTADKAKPTVFQYHFTLDHNHRYELVLVDDAGRTNKMPPEFVFEALTNHPPELKLETPKGDQRVSSLAEIPFQAQVSDDFGLRAYGIAYMLANGETKTIELGQNTGPNEKRAFKYLLPLENLGAQPDQFVSYYLWADDLGPDGKLRRTEGDMFFAEIKPFDEIFREGQAPDSGGEQGGQQQGNQTQKLSELQKQIISATWNLQRRETGAKPSAKFPEDVKVVCDSQQQALEQLQTLQEKIQDAQLKAFADTAEKEMKKAAGELGGAADKKSTAPLAEALKAEYAASQALLHLQAREYQVARNNRNQRGGGGGKQSNQEQLDELDLKAADNRYETQHDAPAQNPEQHEQLQVANRLKELAQRQEDINERLKELQTALQEAKTEPEREAIRERLKRLREEQQDMLADVDELRQRMDRPENQSRMSETRQQLDQTRSQVESAGEALEKESASQALAAGTRAQQELRQLEQNFRKQNSSQFAEEMRQMRDRARQLAQSQEQISKKLDDLTDPAQKTLGDSDERKALGARLARQKNTITNLFNQMRQVSEQSETAEPLLSKQLYDLLRQTTRDELDKSLDASSELIQRGFLPQAAPFEQRAQQNIDQLKQGVEHAAESVLGDETAALRLAKNELDDLSRQLDKELAQAGDDQQTNSGGAIASNGAEKSTTAQKSDSQSSEKNRQAPGGQKSGDSNQSEASDTQQAGASPNARSSSGKQAGQSSSRTGSAASSPSSAGQTAQAGGGQSGRRTSGSRSADGGNFTGQDGSRDAGGQTGPLAGGDYVGWSDRLRDVEEMVDAPDLRSEVARIRDRARAVRLDYKRLGKKPDWAVVRTQIAQPLAEVRSRVGEELARRESKDALVPLDRDPVPAKFSELVRHYYEQLGKSE